MKLGTKGRYAVMALVDLSQMREGIPVALADVADRQGLSLQYLEQLFLKLRKAGMVLSVRGQRGGYLLAKPPQQIKISDILQASEETLKSTRCSLTQEKGCNGTFTKCATHNLWAGLETKIHEYLNSITLADVCEQRVLPNGHVLHVGEPKATVWSTL
jgi:Rrf2 family iron-sulfur cluster assembly transcriptional regulator